MLRSCPTQIDGSTLRTLCMQHGPLITFHLNLTQGSAVVRYSSKDEAAKAQKSLHMYVSYGKSLRNEVCCSLLNVFSPHPPHVPPGACWETPPYWQSSPAKRKSIAFLHRASCSGERPVGRPLQAPIRPEWAGPAPAPPIRLVTRPTGTTTTTAEAVATAAVAAAWDQAEPRRAASCCGGACSSTPVYGDPRVPRRDGSWVAQPKSTPCCLGTC